MPTVVRPKRPDLLANTDSMETTEVGITTQLPCLHTTALLCVLISCKLSKVPITRKNILPTEDCISRDFISYTFRHGFVSTTTRHKIEC